MARKRRIAGKKPTIATGKGNKSVGNTGGPKNGAMSAAKDTNKEKVKGVGGLQLQEEKENGKWDESSGVGYHNTSYYSR